MGLLDSLKELFNPGGKGRRPRPSGTCGTCSDRDTACGTRGPTGTATPAPVAANSQCPTACHIPCDRYVEPVSPCP